MAAERGVFTLGHSPDPDDAFMFYAMAENKIDLRGYQFEHRLEDIQTLNERALRGELHISAISIHAYAYVSKRYALLPCGASMGDGYGPIVIGKRSTRLRSPRRPKVRQALNSQISTLNSSLRESTARNFLCLLHDKRFYASELFLESVRKIVWPILEQYDKAESQNDKQGEPKNSAQ